MRQILKDAKCPVAAGAQADFRVPVSFTRNDTVLSVMHNPLDIRVSIKDDKGEVLMFYMLQVCYEKKCM